jgi:DNA-binding transcriptional ArsR family regulator
MFASTVIDGRPEEAVSVRDLHHPTVREIDLTRVLFALSDPTRLTIVRELAAADDQPCGSFPVTVSKSTLSQHFAVLRDAGVIRTRVDGTQRFQTLRRAELDKRFPGLLDAVLAASPAR